MSKDKRYRRNPYRPMRENRWNLKDYRIGCMEDDAQFARRAANAKLEQAVARQIERQADRMIEDLENLDALGEETGESGDK